MKFPRKAKIFKGQIDLAPFLSVFFSLTIFMIFGSILISSPGVKIELPLLNEGKLSRPLLPKLDVAVDESGKIHFESQFVNASELRKRLASARKRFGKNAPTLVLQADKDADLQTLLQICQIAGEVGIDQTIWMGRPHPFENHKVQKVHKVDKVQSQFQNSQNDDSQFHDSDDHQFHQNQFHDSEDSENEDSENEDSQNYQ